MPEDTAPHIDRLRHNFLRIELKSRLVENRITFGSLGKLRLLILLAEGTEGKSPGTITYGLTFRGYLFLRWSPESLSSNRVGLWDPSLCKTCDPPDFYWSSNSANRPANVIPRALAIFRAVTIVTVTSPLSISPMCARSILEVSANPACV